MASFSSDYTGHDDSFICRKHRRKERILVHLNVCYHQGFHAHLSSPLSFFEIMSIHCIEMKKLI